MRVKVCDEYSEIKYILSGVPQGSVLGPLLFLLFVNDLPEGIKSIFKLFADDVIMIVNPFNNLIDDLQFLELWEAYWCLKFNIVWSCKLVLVILRTSAYLVVFL